MILVICAVLFLASFLAMEVVAWFTHKYIMHGFLWSWHASHHKAHKYFFEKNDRFFMVFAGPSMVCFWGAYQGWSQYLLSIGAGILGYGLFYLLFHDILVHRRLPIKWKPKKGYLARMMRAHYAHHKKHTKTGCESFGFLIATKKYTKKS